MPASPSLLIVPARFKTGKLYTQIATTSGGLVLGSSGDFNVTRATTATRFNSAGLIESVASGVPRLDYFTSGGTAGCPALLVEPAATNFAPNADLLSDPSPITASGGLTITTGSTDFLAPNGASGAITKYVGGTASGQVFATYSSTFNMVSGSVVASMFVKAGSTNPLNFCAIEWTGLVGISGTTISYFNLASGTALTSGASIQDYGNGWYRIICAPTTIASGDINGRFRFYFAEGDSDVNWPASGALNLTAYAWGPQIETGSVATSYIPTTTGSASRNADVVNLTGAVSGCIGQTEGTIYAEVDVRNLTAGARVPIYLLNALGSPTDSVRFEFSNSNGWQATVRANNANAFTVSGPTSQPQGIYKVAFGYKSGNSALYINGGEAATNSSSFIFNAVLAIVAMHGITAGANVFNDRIRAAALYTSRLSNAELIALSTL
jgi:hypothetical protein